METIIARQPIFNFNKRLFAYELLYSGVESLKLIEVEKSDLHMLYLDAVAYADNLASL
ncbi:MAG: c-di-GMP-related signal transduction protein [Desulforhopalus sp.]|jgi:c-di-GMP-related signal transduction protein